MTILNVPGKIYLNLGPIEPDDYDWNRDFDTSEITWFDKSNDPTDLMYVQEQLFNDQVKKANMFKKAYAAAKDHNAELRYIIKKAIKHDNPAIYLANELRILEDEE